MTQGVLDLIQAIQEGDSEAIDAAFNAEMAERVSARIDGMREGVAKSMFDEACGSKKKMKEEVKEERSEEEIVEEMINEVLGKNEPAGAWIHDFVHSDNPKFAGKSDAKRKQMALAAYYAKQKNEELDVTEMLDYLSENEEVLAELSKATLANYSQKAAHDVGNKLHSAGYDRGVADAATTAGKASVARSFNRSANKSHSKALTRLSGIKTAAKKLAK